MTAVIHQIALVVTAAGLAAAVVALARTRQVLLPRSEEHTSELQSP